MSFKTGSMHLRKITVQFTVGSLTSSARCNLKNNTWVARNEICNRVAIQSIKNRYLAISKHCGELNRPSKAQELKQNSIFRLKVTLTFLRPSNNIIAITNYWLLGKLLPPCTKQLEITLVSVLRLPPVKCNCSTTNAANHEKL